MRNHYLVCEKCKKTAFFGQGYGVIQVRGNEKKNITDFIAKHFECGIEVLDENDMYETIENQAD